MCDPGLKKNMEFRNETVKVRFTFLYFLADQLKCIIESHFVVY